MGPGDRVRLMRAPEWRGKVDKVKDGKADVTFDGNGRGRFPVDDLEPAEDRPEDAEDKSWPPKGLETKVPTMDGGK